MFIYIDVEEISCLKCSVLVDEYLSVKIFIDEIELCFKEKLPVRITDIRHLIKILDFAESTSVDQALLTKNEASILIQELTT